ncbi:MAG: hypothetical protein ACI9Q3_000681, partial [Maribacter sp.]
MNDYKLSTLFLLQKVRINKQGKCPIRCRVTYLKTRKIFSTGLFITKFYKRKDVRLNDLDLKFIQDLEYFFK